MRKIETIRLPMCMVMMLFMGCMKPGGQMDDSAPAADAATHREGADPKINDRFNDAPDIAGFEERWESEDRDIFQRRHAIVAASRIEAGQAVADIGAGTGLFVPLLADAVGPKGRVVAVDISAGFLEHIQARAASAGLEQVTTVLGTDHTTHLEADSIDVAFVCATYHHFEYPSAMLTSIHRALRRSGTLVIVDFERIPGKSREWIFGHVRAGREQVIREITAAGFKHDPSATVDGLEENYFALFVRRP